MPLPPNINLLLPAVAGLGERPYQSQPEGIEILLKITCKFDLLLLQFMAMWMEDDRNRVHMSRKRRAHIKKLFKVGKNRLVDSLRRLKQIDAIAGERAEFFVNPQLFKYLPTEGSAAA